MNNPKIELLVFEDCPLADAARKTLGEALGSLGLSNYEEVDLLDPDTPDEIRGWGSPTILVNGKDITGGGKGDSVGCRVYTGRDRVPSAKAIASYLTDLTEEE